MSDSNRRRPRYQRSLRRTANMAALRSGGLEHAPHRGHQLVEGGDLGGQLLAPGPGELVVAGPAPGGRDPPLGLDPALEPEALEGGVERAFLDPERLRGQAPDVLRDAVAVHRPEGEGLEEEEVEGAGEEVDLEGIARGSHSVSIHRLPMGGEATAAGGGGGRRGRGRAPRAPPAE